MNEQTDIIKYSFFLHKGPTGRILCTYPADNNFFLLQVFYYDGSIRCFDKEQHLGLAIFALFLGVLVVILFPVLIFVISFKHFKVITFRTNYAALCIVLMKELVRIVIM